MKECSQIQKKKHNSDNFIYNGTIVKSIKHGLITNTIAGIQYWVYFWFYLHPVSATVFRESIISH